MKKLLLSLCAITLATATQAQDPCLWAKRMGSTGSDVGGSIAVDSTGNIYTAGSFAGTVDFDPGAGTLNLTSAGNADIFVSKLDAKGNFVWAKRIGGASNDNGYSITVDNNGNVYTTGRFIGTVDFDPGAGSFNITAVGTTTFVSKLDASGNFVWAKRMGGTVAADYSVGYSIAVDGSGNIYTAGNFQNAIDFDPGAGTFNLTSASANISDVFVSKLNPSGNFLWAKRMGGTGTDYSNGIAVDSSGNAYTTGNFSGIADFGIFNLLSAGQDDIFVCKLDASGNFVWTKGIGGTKNDAVNGIAVDLSGNVYTTGQFDSIADFDPGAGAFNLLAVDGGINSDRDIFVSKLDSTGDFVWAKSMGGTTLSDYGIAIAVDNNGNVYSTGSFDGTANFDPGTGTFNLTGSGGFQDIYVSKLDISGNFVWAKKMGGTSNEAPYSIALDINGNVYTTGVFAGTVDFDPGSGTLNLISSGGNDIFVSKIPSSSFTIPTSTLNCFGDNNGTATITGVIGGSTPFTYNWSNGQTTQTATGLSNGIYYVTVNDAAGCNKTGVANISQPPQILFNATASNVSCNGGNNGSITVTASGGTGGLQYSKDGGTTYQSTNIFNNLSAGSYSIRVKDANNCITSIVTVAVTEPPLLTTSIAKSDVKCYGEGGGTATATPTGGTSPYNYNWSNGQATQTIGNLFPGIYSVNIFDNKGCATSSIISISQPAPLAVSLSAINNTCNGASTGSAIVAPEGGTSPYSYLWNTGATTSSISNLPSSTYFVTITDSCNFSKVDSVVITQPQALASSVAVNNISCTGFGNGSAIANPSGGTSPYTYQWSNSATTKTISGLSPAMYYVTITDNCSLTKIDSATISEPSALSVTSITKTNATCNGVGNGTATINPAGGTSPYSYNWSNGQNTQTAIGLFAGTYGVNVFDSKGCLASNSVAISQPAQLAATLSSSNVTCHLGSNGSATAIISGGTSPYSYLWNDSAATTTTAATGLKAGTYSVIVNDSCGASQIQSINITEPGVLSTTVTKNNVSCNGGTNGSASVSVSGGVTPYTYSWSNTATTSSISNLPSSVYYVTATDNCGQTKIDSAVISEPTLLSSSVSKTDVTCNGAGDGTATVIPANGTSPYTYFWSNNQTTATAVGLFPGFYSVNVVDANGCLATSNTNITQPPAISVTLSASYVSCNAGSDGAATATVSGGTSPYSYIWSNGATTSQISNLTSQIYFVTITESCGASLIQSINITEPGVLSTTITKNNVSCNGGTNGSASVSISGGVTPYSYNWSNGSNVPQVTNVPAGNYIVTITDNCGQSKTDSAVISEPTLLSSSVSKTDVTCNGAGDGTATVIPANGTSPYTYFWSNNQTTATAVGLFPGFYSVNVVDANGCLATSNTNITQPPAMSVTLSASYVSCNAGSDGVATATVSGGTSPYSYLWSNGDTTSQISNLTSQIYSVTVTESCGASQIQSINITEPGVLSTTITKTNVSCSGGTNGSASVSISGGVTPYSYIWNNGATTSQISNLTSQIYFVTATDNCGQTKIDSAIISEPSLLTSSVTKTDITCNGFGNGTATVTASGGVSPYSYTWSNGQNTATAIGLFANNYSVNVFDANFCLASNVVTISQPSVLSLNISSSTATCGNADATATATVSGGTTPYFYLWGNGDTTATANGLNNGNNSVSVTDANNCTPQGGANINIGVAALPQEICLVTVDTSNTKNLIVWEKPAANNIDSFRVYRDIVGTYAKIGTVAYSDLSKFLDNTNGINPNITSYKYKITALDTCGNESVLSTHHKTMHLTKNVGTQGEVNLIWDGYEGFSSNFYYRILKDSIGSGNFIAIDSVSNSNFTYTATPPTVNTQYIIEVVHPSGGCTVTKSSENHNSSRSNKTSSAPPGNSLSASTSTIPASAGNCDGTAVVTATGGLTPYTYQWDGNTGGQTTDTASGLCPGTYSVTVTDATGATTFVFATVDVMPGINSIAHDKFDVAIFPNPNKGEFNVRIKSAITDTGCELKIFNMLGEIVYKSAIKNQQSKIDLSKHGSGIYYLQIISENGNSIPMKLIVH